MHFTSKSRLLAPLPACFLISLSNPQSLPCWPSLARERTSKKPIKAGPAVGSQSPRPQQLPRGCPKPRRAASSQAWPPANTSSFRSQTTRLPAPVGLSRDSAGGNRIHLREPEACEEGSSCISPGGVVNKTPDPHPHPGRDASQPPAQSLLAHASILSPLPVSSCVCVFLPLSI